MAAPGPGYLDRFKNTFYHAPKNTVTGAFREGQQMFGYGDQTAQPRAGYGDIAGAAMPANLDQAATTQLVAALKAAAGPGLNPAIFRSKTAMLHYLSTKLAEIKAGGAPPGGEANYRSLAQSSGLSSEEAERLKNLILQDPDLKAIFEQLPGNFITEFFRVNPNIGRLLKGFVALLAMYGTYRGARAIYNRYKANQAANAFTIQNYMALLFEMAAAPLKDDPERSKRIAKRLKKWREAKDGDADACETSGVPLLRELIGMEDGPAKQIILQGVAYKCLVRALEGSREKLLEQYKENSGGEFGITMQSLNESVVVTSPQAAEVYKNAKALVERFFKDLKATVEKEESAAVEKAETAAETTNSQFAFEQYEKTRKKAKKKRDERRKKDKDKRRAKKAKKSGAPAKGAKEPEEMSVDEMRVKFKGRLCSAYSGLKDDATVDAELKAELIDWVKSDCNIEEQKA